MDPKTIAEVLDQLDIIISDAKKYSSRLGYFPALYRRVTAEVKNRIDQNYFDDNARMERLDVIFANRYLSAYRSFQQGQPCSTSWKMAFDATSSWRPLVLQHLFLGMNAHISLDLGIAAATIASDNTINSLQGDFNKINIILSSLVDTVQTELAQFWPILKGIDWLAGNVDEKVAKFSMTIARDAAWKMAQQYALLQTGQQDQYVNVRDKKVADFAQKIYQPRFLLNAISILRAGEICGVRKKIEILNK